MFAWPANSRKSILFRLGHKGKCTFIKQSLKYSSVRTLLRSTQVQPQPVFCLLPIPHSPSVVLPSPHLEKAWPQAQTPIQAGGRGKCTVLGPFSEKLRVPGIPGEYLPVPRWPEHRLNNKELERDSSKLRGASGTQMTFDSAFLLPHFRQGLSFHTRMGNAGL